MNALFIWNKHSKDYIQCHLQNTKQFGGECRFITTKDEYDLLIASFEKKQGKTKGSKASKGQKNTFTNIYICVELNWGENPIYEGYKAGYDLIRLMNISEFCIRFYSFRNRKNIYSHIPDKYKFLVKALPFENVLCIKEGYNFPVENMSSSKLNFFKTYAFLDYGIIDDFAHRLRGMSDSQTQFADTFKKYAAEILSYKQIIGQKIQEYLESIAEYTNENRIRLIQLLEERVSELTGAKPSKPKEFQSQYRLLVIEDNADDLDTIKTSLRRYYNDGGIFRQNALFLSSGEDALNLIKSNGDDFDFIITDLELLDADGFYQPVHGVDIYDYAKNHLKKAVTGVITGYGRKGIEKLLKIDQDYILSKQHLHRFGNEEIDRLMKNLLSGYTKKEQDTFYDVGPDLGIFSEPGYRNELSRLINEDKNVYHANMWTEAKRLAGLYINNRLSFDTPGWSAEIKSAKTGIKDFSVFIKEKHAIVLAHRLIALHYFLDNNNSFDQDAFKEKVSSFMNFENYGKDYLTTRLGIRRSFLYAVKSGKIDSNGEIIDGIHQGKNYTTIHQIEFKNLFPEERGWVEKFKKSPTEIKLKDNTKHTIKWLKEKYSPYFPEEKFDNYTFLDLLELFTKKLLNKYKNERNETKRNEMREFIQDNGIPRAVDSELTSLEKRQINAAIENLDTQIEEQN